MLLAWGTKKQVSSSTAPINLRKEATLGGTMRKNIKFSFYYVILQVGVKHPNAWNNFK